MAKGKNLNPADAFRKAQRKKELKKNKADRSKARDFALVKKDTRELEEEIEKLEAASEPSAADKTRLAELKSELEKITKKKEEYVAEHPEHRKLVFKSHRQSNAKDEKEEGASQQTRNLFNKHGLPRHPERSIYYDPALNPYGVPPPGMPYVERPLRPDELASGDEGEGDDDDIVMPDGPPPGAAEEDDSDDDIPMPEGPPPTRDGDAIPSLPPSTLPSRPSLLPPSLVQSQAQAPTQLPIGLPPAPMSLPTPPPPPGFPAHGLPPLPAGFPAPVLPPPGFPTSALPPLPAGFPAPPPPPPPGFASSPLSLPPPGFLQMPPPPPGFAHSQFPLPPLGSGYSHLPSPPPGFYPRRSQSTSAMQDPLSSIPHQTFQAHRASRTTAPAHPSLPPNPTQSQSSTSGGVALGAGKGAALAATIEAAPQLRDFKKEATAFVPTTLKRKRAVAGAGATSKVNAAPSLAPAPDSAEPEPSPVAARPDLLSTLNGQFGPAVGNLAAQTTAASASTVRTKPKDDYAKFVEEMGDILGPKA